MENPLIVNLIDGGLGRSQEGVDGIHLKIGVGEIGDTDMIYPIVSEREAIAKFGKGPLVDSLVRHFREGGIRCFALRPDNDVEGEIGTVTQEGTGSAICTPSGTPIGSRDFVVEIILGGAHETATYRWSEDGGINWSDVYVTPAASTPITLSAGVSITFTGTDDCFVAGDTYSFSSTAPSASVTNFLAAIDEAKEQYDPKSCAFKFVHVVGGFDRSFWTSVSVKAEDFDDARIFVPFILEYPPKESGTVQEYLQEILDEGRLFQHKRVAIVGGRMRYGDDTDFKSVAIFLCANLSRARVNIHPGWVKEFKSVSGKEIQFWKEGLQDFTEDLDESNIILAVSYQNWEGIYVKKDHLMSPSDSDFQTIHDLRPADKVRFIAYEKIMPFVNSDNNPAEGDASGIESLIAELDAEISGRMEKPGEMEIAGHEVDIDTGQDLSDGELEGEIHIYKTDTMEKITIDVGYKKTE